MNSDELIEHGGASAPAARVALLIDVINDMEFDGSEALVRQGLPMAHRAPHHMETILKATTTPSAELRLESLLQSQPG